MTVGGPPPPVTTVVITVSGTPRAGRGRGRPPGPRQPRAAPAPASDRAGDGGRASSDLISHISHTKL